MGGDRILKFLSLRYTVNMSEASFNTENSHQSVQDKPNSNSSPNGKENKSPWIKRFKKQLAAGVVGLSMMVPSDRGPEAKQVVSDFSPIPAVAPAQKVPVESGTPTPLPVEDLSIPEYPRIEHAQNVLAILAHDNDAAESIGVDKEKEILENVSDFFAKSSYGKLKYDFQVVDWQKFEEDLDFNKPEEASILIDARLHELEDKNELPYDLSTFQTRLYVVDHSNTLPISGHGVKREPYNKACVYLDEYKDGLGGTVHEMGHTLGLGHVDGYGCKHDNDYTNDCRTTSAGGRSVMGGDYESDIAGPQKLALGWIGAEQVETVTKDTEEVKLTPLEKEDPGKKLLRIQKKDTGDYYYIEYSVPDRPNEDPTLNFYIWDQKKESNLKQFAATGSYFSKDGSQFYDKINGIKVTQMKHDNGEVTVSVSFDK